MLANNRNIFYIFMNYIDRRVSCFFFQNLILTTIRNIRFVKFVLQYRVSISTGALTRRPPENYRYLALFIAICPVYRGFRAK